MSADPLSVMRWPRNIVTRGVVTYFFRRCCCVTVIASSLALMCTASAAFDLDAMMEDPLLTMPPAVKRGAAFPDGSLVRCPALVDLGHPLRLKEVMFMALCNNPQVRQAWFDIKIAAGQLGEARSTYLPTASLTYSPYQANQVDYPDFMDNSTFTEGRMASANFSWRMLDFGARDANHASATLALQSAFASHEAIIQRAMQVLTQYFFDVLNSEASLRAKNDAVALSRSAWEATLRREAKGVADKNDSLQAQSSLAKSRLAASRATGDASKAQATLVAAMGLATGTPIRLDESSGMAKPDLVSDLDYWLATAEQGHPAIRSAKLQWEASKAKVKAASATGLPSLDFVASLYQNGLPNQGVQATSSYTGNAGITINIPVFEGFGTTYKVRGAQATADKAQAQMEDTEHQVLTEIVKAHADAVSSFDNLDSSLSLVNAAAAAVESASKRYEAGASDILELLNAQSALAQAKEERLRCLSEWRSARLRLIAGAGVLSQINEPD